jgi:glycosyltransferase involved in cell wall biosynthesis
MPSPKVSIGLPVYNGEKYLWYALDSILRQDYADFELIISDNASTDATQAICREFASKDSRVRYLRNEENIGAAANFNRVFKLARADFFKWAAYDDVCLPGFLRRCVEVLDQAPPTVGVVIPWTEIIDENGVPMKTEVAPECLDTRRPRPHQRLADVLRTVSWAPAQYGLMRAEVLRKTRLVDAFYGCDYVLLVELASLVEIWEVPQVLFQIRFHPEVSTLANKIGGELSSWFDPAKKGRKRLLSPHARLLAEFGRSISRMRMPLSERLLCYLTVILVWCPRECRRLARQWRNRIALRTRLKQCWRVAGLAR